MNYEVDLRELSIFFGTDGRGSSGAIYAPIDRNTATAQLQVQATKTCDPIAECPCKKIAIAGWFHSES